MQNKRGIELSQTTTILLILAVVVIVFSVSFVTKANQQSLDKDTNLDLIASECKVLCFLSASSAYCYQERPFVKDRKTFNDETCYTLSNLYPSTFNQCSQIKCDENFDSDKVVISPGDSDSFLDLSLTVFESQRKGSLPSRFQASESEITQARNLLSKFDTSLDLKPISPLREEHLDVKLSSSLILFQKVNNLEDITGLPSDETLKRLAQCVDDNPATPECKKIGSFQFKKETPESNAHLDWMTVLPTMNPIPGKNGQRYYAFAETQTAVAWAYMVQTAMKEEGLNPERFVVKDADCAYRALYDQIVILLQNGCCDDYEINKYCEPFNRGDLLDNYVNIPNWKDKSKSESWIEGNYKDYCTIEGQESQTLMNEITRGNLMSTATGRHAKGLALDLDLKDGQYSMSTPEGKWLAANANLFGFCSYADKNDPTHQRYVETWHWEYHGSSACP